jgi:hypothetical protein
MNETRLGIAASGDLPCGWTCLNVSWWPDELLDPLGRTISLEGKFFYLYKEYQKYSKMSIPIFFFYQLTPHFLNLRARAISTVFSSGPDP